MELVQTRHHTTPWFVDVFVEKRDELAEYLKKNGIETRKIYPTIPSQKCYNSLNEYPVAEKASKRGLWLPSSIPLKSMEIKFVCDRIKEFFDE